VPSRLAAPAVRGEHPVDGRPQVRQGPLGADAALVLGARHVHLVQPRQVFGEQVLERGHDPAGRFLGLQAVAERVLTDHAQRQLAQILLQRDRAALRPSIGQLSRELGEAREVRLV
jgi:hypothetical protein